MTFGPGRFAVQAPVRRVAGFMFGSPSRRQSGGMRILVVEDDSKLGGLLRRGLSAGGNAADLAATGEDALWMAKATSYDAIVLDLMLPGLDGFQTCARLRADGVWAPVLMLTARDAIEDRVAGLDSGADDYLTKPFSIAELRARLRAVVRRGGSERPAVLEVGSLRLDPATRQVWRGETEVVLANKELALLELFMRRPGQVVSRYQLLEHAWDMAYDNRSNVVTVHIRRLREKIDRPFGVRSIETVRGAGYRLRRDGGA
ncbi:MAG: two-component system, OmpR family, response regulator [Gaiellaceae bacterium]|nr:two-component system, OmpR family, response regulator [Gaiellaceae bacterium]